MLLGDFGAEVIKIESPIQGDETRTWGPPWAGNAEDRLSAYFLSINRNKRGITLDLKSLKGQAIAKALALQSDIIVENFKVGGMAAYGLDYATLCAENPRLIYCSITGYGQTGPYAAQPGYDYVIQAQSGLMSITGPIDDEPYKVGVAISDVVTGLSAANAIQSALHFRDLTGQGQYIDIALLDSQIAALVNVASNFLVGHTSPRRYGNAHANIVPYESFPASDGFFILAVGNDAQFRRCCEVIGKPEWASDPRFATNPERVAQRDILIPELRRVLVEKPLDYWLTRFREADIACGPINSLDTILHDPQITARGLVQPITLDSGTQVNVVGPTAQLSATPPQIRLSPPTLGRDTDAVLSERLGYSAETCAALRHEGVI
jgi:formyl-CoA transferase